jgi:hypothetical protein
MRRRAAGFHPIVAALLFFAASAAARAQFPGSVPDTFRLNVGGMYAWFNTDVTFEQNGGAGPSISFEDALDVPKSHAGFYGRGSLNFGFLSFDVGYLGFSRSRTTTIGQDIVFGDTTYTIGASVEARQKSQLPYGDIRFNFLHNPSTQLGLTLGVAYPILEAEITSSAGVIGPGGPIIGQTVTTEGKIQTPVPLLGIVFDAALGNDVSAGIVFNGIFAPVHPYVGSIFQADAHVDWYFANHFGIGGAFNYTRFRIKKDDLPDTLVDFRHDFYGPRAYLILTF